MQQISQRVLRLFVSGSLLAMITLLTFNVGTTNADTCSSGMAVGNCTTSISTLLPASGTLTYSADSAITYNTLTAPPSPPAGYVYGKLTPVTGGGYTYPVSASNEIFGIAFGTKVFEGRVGTAGWSIAASTNINNGGIIALTSSTPVCTSTASDGTTLDCYPADSALIKATPQLTDVAQPFVSAPAIATGDTTDLNVGNYTITTAGTLTLPNTLAPGTNVTGNIIITLASLPS